MMPLAQKNNMPCFQTWKKKENIHRNSNGFGVFARAYVRNSIGRNAQMYFLRKSSKGVVPFSNVKKSVWKEGWIYPLRGDSIGDDKNLSRLPIWTFGSHQLSTKIPRKLLVVPHLHLAGPTTSLNSLVCCMESSFEGPSTDTIILGCLLLFFWKGCQSQWHLKLCFI